MNGIEPQRECPRFERCSVNHCPLDPFQDEHLGHPDDKEQVCGVAKAIRVRIASQYPDLLPMGGLKPREWAGKQAFARLSPSEKAEMVKRGKESISRLNRTKTDLNPPE